MSKYNVYVKPGARGKVKAAKAVRRLNKQAGTKVAQVVKKKSKADAIIQIGGRPPRGGWTHVGPNKTKITIDPKAIKSNTGTKIGRATQRRLTEHEVGHAVGLKHRKGPANLMNPDGGGSHLTKTQKTKVRKAASKPKPKPTRRKQQI